MFNSASPECVEGFGVDDWDEGVIHDKFKRVPQNIKPGPHHSTSGLSNILVCIESNPTVYAAGDSVVDTVDVGTGCWIRFVIYDNIFNDFVDIWNAISSLVRFVHPLR